MDERDPLLPHPPKPRTSADYIATAFAIAVCVCLVVIALGLVVIALFTDDPISEAVAAMSEVLASLVSALIGYMAGRGVARGDR